VDRWWRARAALRIVSSEGGWRIEGPDSGRARLAFASLVDDRVVFELARQ
jgi:hypothetical protein